MGITVWYLGIDENNELHRLPLSIFDGGKSKIQNQFSKVMELAIQNENRKPSKIVRALYFKLKFKEDGTIDEKDYNESTKLKINSISILGDELQNSHIVSRLKYEIKYSWTPVNDEIKMINKYLNKKGMPLNELLPTK